MTAPTTSPDQIAFEDDVAVVTGAGRGLGRAYAHDLAARGARVVVNDVDGAAAAAVVEEISAAGGTAIASADSVTTREGGSAIVGGALDAFGRLDIVINNAGFLRPGYFETLTPTQIGEIFAVHLHGAFNVTQPAWPVMQQQGYGRVVMTSSPSGLFSDQCMSNYSTAKAGLYGLTKALAFEGRHHGIRVNVVAPYAATTITADNPIPDITDTWTEVLPAGLTRDAMPPERRDPALVAALVTFLCSRGCQVTGEAYSVCGGRFARIFVGVAEGWLAADPATVSAEAVAGHFEEIRDVSRATIPMRLFDEWIEVVSRLRPR